MKSFFVFIWEIAKIVIIALVIVLPIRSIVFQPFFVKGDSMTPNFENGDYLIVDEISYKIRDPQRGEVIVFKYPNDTSQRYIKRIIGLPGETVQVENGQIVVYNEEGGKILQESEYLSPSVFTPGDTRITLGENEYFVLGDNRAASSDSRRWGSLPKEDIIGRALLRAWPLAALAKIEVPEYSSGY
ncbi:MAG: signal peptidase I [Candidatus Pacebacteria bacterium]|nr:signal peptidase I [Candidatus Paceibacterota bacterium]